MSNPEALVRLLRAQPNLPAGTVRDELGVNRTTLMRMVRAAGAEVVSYGRARRTRYSARRHTPRFRQPLPLFVIEPTGAYSQAGLLHLAHPTGSVLEWEGSFPWPLDDEMEQGWFDGLPYFLHDLWPEGFLGRAFVRAYARLLELPEDPKRWNEEHVLLAVSKFGSDPVGSFILGDAALQRFLEELQNPPAPLREEDVEIAYARLADAAMANGHPGSSAAGEFPKFTAARQEGAEVLKVLVKFSGSDASPNSERWSDLLVCEHWAARILPQFLGIAAADSRIIQAARRTFLETTRFDRHGAHGRSPVCTWAAINHAWFGMSEQSWGQGAVRLRERGLIEQPVAEDIAHLAHFGRLIANTDMHDGNLSFRPTSINGRAGFELAPAYDMLPMQYAPVRGVELPQVTFQPHLPVPAERAVWARAADAAVQFWDAAAHDDRISQAFRQTCRQNRDLVHRAINLAVTRSL